MSIKGFDFNGVVHKYDYNALDNIPDIETDKTLTIDGAPADAKATGDRIANLQALVGSPLTASTAAGMIDNSKVYVYVGSETGYTNGNWYYYDGSAWVSGGVYNSVAVDIDTTLTLSNKAPDSKVVGDAISSLNEDITNLAPAIKDIIGDPAYSHEIQDESQIAVNGNTFEHETVKLCDSAILRVNGWRTVTSNGVTYTADGDSILINGTSTATSSAVWTMMAGTGITIPEELRGKTVRVRIVSDKPCTLPAYSTTTNCGISMRLREAGASGDGRQMPFMSFGVLDNDYIDIYADIDVGANDDLIYGIIRYVPSGAVFDNVRIQILAYDTDATVVDTQQTIEDEDTALISIPSGWTFVDSGIHKHALYGTIDTKQYVDNNIPSDVITMTKLQQYIPNVKNRAFVTPEMYGAAGDGQTDDSVALQNAIDAAIAANLPLCGFGNYYITTGVIISGNYLFVYIHKIEHKWSEGPGVTLRGRYNHLIIDLLYCYGATGGPAFRMETTENTHADYNVIEIQNIYSYGNCVEYLNPYGKSHGSHLYYNKFYTSMMYSRQGNCFYFNGYQHFGENSFWGKHVGANNGYLIYCDTPDSGNSSNKFYEFTMEDSLANGVYGIATLINVRTAECAGRRTLDDPTIGNIYVVGNSWPAHACSARNTDVPYNNFVVDNARSYDDTIQELVRRITEEGKTTTVAFDGVFGGMAPDYTVGKCRTLYFAYDDPVVRSSGSRIQEGTLIAYWNHKGFVPTYPVKETIENADYHTFSTTGRFPTIFDIGITGEIYLDDSYCAVGITDITIIQREGYTTKIYAKDGTTVLFDGTNLGNGTFVLHCRMVPLDGLTLTWDGGGHTWSKYYCGHIYTGANEEWVVEKLNIIS